MTGRPSKYSEALASKICKLIAEGEKVVDVCKRKGMPSVGTVFRWMHDKEGFREMYDRAREERAHRIFDDMLEIADDGTNDYVEKFNKNGESMGPQLDSEHVQRSRLRIETRKWIVSKLCPKQFGDRQQMALTGPEDGPVQVTIRKISAADIPKPKSKERGR